MEHEIDRLAEDARKWVEDSRFVPPVKARYCQSIDAFVEYAASVGHERLTPGLVSMWAEVAKYRAQSRDAYRLLMLGVRLMCGLAGLRSAPFEEYRPKGRFECDIPEKFLPIYDAYEAALMGEDLQRKTKSHAKGDVRRLLFFLDGRINALTDLTIDDLDASMADFAPRLAAEAIISLDVPVRDWRLAREGWP